MVRTSPSQGGNRGSNPLRVTNALFHRVLFLLEGVCVMAEKEKPAYLGHRDRVRQKIEEFGFDNMAEADLLEYLLFFAIPRCDTYTLSRRLINEFGSFREVLNATAEELCEIDGIGKESAYFLTSFIPVFKAYHAGAFIQKKPLTKMSDCLSFLRVQTLGARCENFIVLYLTPQKTLIRHEIFSNEDWSIVSINMDRITRKAVSLKAASIIIGHNHITSKLFPSEEDITSTSLLAGKLGALGIQFIDSIIFDEYDFYSFKENNLL